MVFSSLLFLFRFLPAVLILYYIAPRKLRNVILLLFSLFFYAWGEPKYVFLMLFTITMDFFIGKGIDKAKKEGNQKKAKRFLMTSILVDLSILGFFKYADFLIGTVNTLTGAGIPLLGIPLPIGISFFTFQTMSYTIDVYKGNTEVQKNWIKYGTYVSMFPQLIAGPIVRYVDIEEQLEHRSMNVTKFGQGAMYFMRGLAKKVILANTTGAVFEQIAAMHLGSYSVMTAWIGCISYAFQIYFDFGGYSDMAIGLGKMFGFEFLENFHYPYVSTSVTEFWRRWHISLSTWFREYVYIPLGGNRKGDSRTITNLLIVWMLTGFWHGAAWNFVAWGLYYGIILILEKFVWGQYVEKWPGAVRHIYAMVLILIGWVLFFSPSLGYALKYVGVMFGIGASGLMDKLGWFYLLSNWLIYLMAVLGSSSIGYRLMRNIQRAPGSRVGKYTMTGVMYLVMFALSLAFLVTQSFNPFLYFRF